MNTSLLDEIQEIYYPETDGEPMGETDLHINLIMDLKQSLKIHFQEDDVYVACDLLLYYEKGNPKKFVVPDVMVVFGSHKGNRRVYKLWDEGRAPNVVIEISSQKTWKKDLEEKQRLYAGFGVREYYVFDPERLYLPEPLMAYRLDEGALIRVEVVNNRIYSELLELELVDTGETLRLFNRQTGEILRTAEETEAARREAEEALSVEVKARREEEKARREENKARREAEARAREETEKRMQFEKELERLREELAKLKQERE